MAFLPTQGYKGTRDLYPFDKERMNFLFQKMHACSRSFSYQEYDGPLLESFELYAAKTGEEIVQNQLYSFLDRGDRKVAIRPEMTPTLARMVAARLAELPQPIRWYSIPNLLRYERPQRGRLREFWQWNVDVLGGQQNLADIEILTVILDFFERLGGLSFFKIKINHRAFMDHFFQNVLKVPSDQAQKLSKLMDARGKMGEEKFQETLRSAGLEDSQKNRIDKFFSARSLKDLKNLEGPGFLELNKLFEQIDALGLSSYCEFDPNILRGLDYYTGLVFEGFDVSPENHRALFGGGRYDNLIGLFGKQNLSGVGFGLGEVPLTQFCETHQLFPENLSPRPDYYLGLLNEKDLPSAGRLARKLRAQGKIVFQALKIESLSSHLRAANKIHAHYAVLLTEEELSRNQALVKNLKTGEQSFLSLEN